MHQEEVQNKCQTTYLNNLRYFEEKHPVLFKNITLFEVACEQGMYKEKYALDYKNNSFNIKVLEDESYIYDTNIQSDAIKKLSKIDFSDKQSIKSFTPIDVPDDYVINEDITKTHLETLFPLIQFTQKYSTKEMKLTRLEKFIFFGALLGAFIELFIKTHKPKAVLIVERDIEIFKLSLFVTDYSKLAETTSITFAVTQDQEIFSQTILPFLDNFNIYNYIIKFHIENASYLKYIETYLNNLSVSLKTDFPFSLQLMTIQRQVRLFKDEYKFIDFNKDYNIFTKDTPVIIIAPGPSLAKNIDWLKENEDKFILVALGASLKTLYKHSIKPNVIISVDPTLDIMDQFEGIDKTFYDDVMIFASSNSPDAFFDIFDTKNTYIYQVMYDLFSIGTFVGKSVGDVTFNLLLKLNVKTIYLLGTDLSVDSETGSMHVKEHQHYEEFENVEKHKITNNNFVNSTDFIEQKGNFQDTIITTRHFKKIIELYELYLSDYDDVKVYNLSNGAYIKGTIAMKTNELTSLKSFKIKNTLDLLSTEIISAQNEVEDVKMKLLSINNILDIYNNYINNSYNSYNEMMYDKFTITIDVITIIGNENRLPIAYSLINSFNDNVEGYINTFFHIKKNQVNKKRFNTIFKLWLKPQMLIIEKYKEILLELDKIQQKS